MITFPIYTKDGISVNMLLSANEVVTASIFPDGITHIKHMKYDTLTTNAFDEYIADDVTVISHDEFLAAYVSTQGAIRNIINLHQPIEMDHTSILINESKNEIK